MRIARDSSKQQIEIFLWREREREIRDISYGKKVYTSNIGKYTMLTPVNRKVFAGTYSSPTNPSKMCLLSRAAIRTYTKRDALSQKFPHAIFALAICDETAKLKL